MLGELLIEETGKTTGIRVLSCEPGDITVEVSVQTEGRLLGVAENTLWTYWSKTRSDGSMYGEGKGMMTTTDGDVIGLLGSGTAKAPGPDGIVHYRGAIYFRTAAARYSRLNGTVGVHEYEAHASGSLTTKTWEWK